MKKSSKPVPKTPAKKAPAIKPLAAAKPKAKPPTKPKAKPAAKPKPREAPDQLELFPILERLAQAAERLAAATAPWPSAAAPEKTDDQGQAALFPIFERLTQSTDKLAQMAELLVRAAQRLAEATVWNAQRREQPPETFPTLSESIADSAAAKERPETADPPDLAIAGAHTETTDAPDLTAPGESAETGDDTQEDE